MQPDSRHINQLLEDPGAIARADIVDLQFWAIQYPQVPLFRVFLAKKAVEVRHEDAQQYRMEAAAMVANRILLYNILENSGLVSNDSTEKIITDEPDAVSQITAQEIIIPEVTAEASVQNEMEVVSQVPDETEAVTGPLSEVIVGEPGEENNSSSDENQISIAPPLDVPSDVNNIDINIPTAIHASEFDKPVSAADQLISTLLAEKEPETPVQKDTERLKVDIKEEPEKLLAVHKEEEPVFLAPPIQVIAEKVEEVFDLTGNEVKPAEIEQPAVVAPDAGLHSFIEWLDLIDKKNEEGVEVRTPVKEDWIEAPAVDYFPKIKDEISSVEDVVVPENKNPTPLQSEDDEEPVSAEPAGEEEKEVVRQAQLSLQFSENLMTETLARLYVKQGKKAKALKIYKALALHNPEKSSYFAALIQQLEE